MTEEYINEINLKYLLNPSKVKINETSQNNLESDIKFYRKRINLLTKNMGKGEYPNNFIKSLYFSYASQIIYYFKSLDQKDIIQEEYLDLSINKFLSNNSDENVIDNLFDESFNNIVFKNKDNYNLNNFVKKINFNNNEKILPQKKILDINNPKFKTKGIKNNLTIL